MKRALIALLLLCTAAPLLAIEASEFAARRARLAKEIGPNGILVVFSAKPATRNGDVDYPFRQSDDLLYLTGIAQTDTTLVMVPGDPAFGEVIFARERNPQQELYTGKVLGNDEVTKISGIKNVFGAGRFRLFVNIALGGGPWPNPDVIDRIPPRATPVFSDAVRDSRAE